MCSSLLSMRGLTLLYLSLASFPAPSVSDSVNQNASSSQLTGSESLLSSGNVALQGDWAVAYNKASALIAGLTNDDKVNIITGADVFSINWTALVFKDGPQGVASYFQASGFGEASSLVQTWDKDLIYDQFKAAGDEIYAKGFQVVNGPTAAPLGRTPFGGRLVETLGQDSYLNGIAFGLGTSAINDAGLIAGGKHFLLNEQETNRTTTDSTAVKNNVTITYSSNADDKTIHEAYLFPFYDAVKAGLGGVMCAMNRVNGTASCENSPLLNPLLKTELGFPGMVFPDQGGQLTSFGSANGGEDYGSSTLWSSTIINAGINNGSLTQARLDDMAIRNVIGYYYAGLDEKVQPSLLGATDWGRNVRANHSKLIREHGAASLSLLKNTNGALPLKAPESIAIFGAHAGPAIGGPGTGFTVTGVPDTYQGHLAGGTGSGATPFPYLVTPHDALLQRAIQDDSMIRWVMNDTYADSTEWTVTGGTTGFGYGTSAAPSFENYVVDMEVCIVFLNAYSGEGGDRSELSNADQDTLVTTIASNCNNTMVVVNTVGARLVDAWIDHENVTAVVYGGLLGQNSGYSITDVLYGDVNPSGRLAYTIAKNESDYATGICHTADCNFTEGVYIDYKYFDAYNITPRYEFGYGLSYTSFTYTDISIEQTASINGSHASGTLTVGGREDLWDNVVNVTATITNSGSVSGHEVAQLYVSFPDE
ncbi:putative beta-glucosidase D, partial [Lachnellula willkommii]